MRLFVPPVKIGPALAVATVDVARLNAALDALAVGPAGENAVPGRLDEFRRFYATGAPIEMGRVNLAPDGTVSFEDGRHRFAVLREMGFRRLPFVVPAAEAGEFRTRFGDAGDEDEKEIHPIVVDGGVIQPAGD
jgi:hypothetical protein